MPEPVARELALPRFLEIGADASLRDAIAKLVEAQQDPRAPNALVAVDADGRYAGILTARLLFRSLLALWSPGRGVRDDDALLERDLLAVAAERARVGIADALVHGLPVASPEAGLVEMIDSVCDQRLEFLPVVESDRCVGLVPVTALFEAAATLALTPDDRGIRVDPA